MRNESTKTKRYVQLAGCGEDNGWWWTHSPEDSPPLIGAQGVDFDGPYATKEEAQTDKEGTGGQPQDQEPTVKESQQLRQLWGQVSSKPLTRQEIRFARLVSDSKREECAKLLEMTSPELLLMAGEMSAQELRTVQAVLAQRARAIRSLE